MTTEEKIRILSVGLHREGSPSESHAWSCVFDVSEKEASEIIDLALLGIKYRDAVRVRGTLLRASSAFVGDKIKCECLILAEDMPADAGDCVEILRESSWILRRMW